MKMNEFNPDIKILNPGTSLKKGCAVAVGSFDGVHLGHRGLISRLVAEARALSLPAAVLTFAPEDNPKGAVGLLAQPELKNRLLAELGVAAAVTLPFSAVKGVSAEAFAKELLLDALGAKSIVCGYDFRFGANRAGDADLLSRLAEKAGVAVHSCQALSIGGKPVSSTDIRALISGGEPEKASELLGRDFSFSAVVEHGRALGRTLGFPTANQKYPKLLAVPKFGVYATRVLLEGKLFAGVTNIGIKPTFGGEGEPLCETHIFGYSGDCYGRLAEIRFAEFIRGERKFESAEALRLQVEKDKKEAFELLKGTVL